MINQQIIVYNKQGNAIAYFYPPDKGNELNNNHMINPTINEVQNGESTFTFSMVSYSQKWKDIQDEENVYLVNGRKYSAMSKNAFSYNDDIVLVTLNELWYELKKKYVQAYNHDTSIEPVDEHSVVLLPKSTEPLIVNGMQISNPYPRGSMGYNIYALLYGSGWSLIYCDVLVDGFSASEDFGVFNIETDQQDILYNIEMVRSLYGGIFAWDSVNKTLSIHDESKTNSAFNKWKGFEVRKGKNLLGLTITKDIDLVTRVYPLGEGKLNIKAVNGGKTYLENFSYTNKEYSLIIENADIYDQKQLKYWGQRQLEKLCKPTTNYSVEIADIRTVEGNEHEFFDLNDIIKITYIDKSTDQEVIDYKRIIAWNYNVFSPYIGSVEVGDKKNNWQEILKQAYEKTDKDSNGNISGEDVFIRKGAGGKTSINQFADETRAEIQLLAEWTDGQFINTRASITLLANETQASINMLTSLNDANTQALASYKQEVTNKYATISTVTQFKNETSNSIASINQTVNEQGSEISLVVGSNKLVSPNGATNASLIVSAINGDSSVSISANRLNLNGVTTLTNQGSNKSLQIADGTISFFGANTLIGEISYDSSGAGTQEEARERFFIRSRYSRPIKIQSDSNMSITSYGTIYCGSRWDFTGATVLGIDTVAKFG